MNTLYEKTVRLLPWSAISAMEPDKTRRTVMAKLPPYRPLAPSHNRLKKTVRVSPLVFPGITQRPTQLPFLAYWGEKREGGTGRKCRAISGFIKYKYPTILAHFTKAGPGLSSLMGTSYQTYCRTEVDAIKGTVSRDFLLLIFFHKTA